ncbi:MAG: site-specific integrase [Spirochaetaceae bacterium]|nr:site-specific integrase [Spirochaetaceae bacterium]
MNAYPFTVFKRSNRPYYFVSYKDASGRFLSPVSTKMKTEKEAMQVAFAWLRDGIPKKNEALKVQDLSLIDVARKIKTDAETETLLCELKRLGWVKSFILKETPQAEDFISFLTAFWDWDTSPYIKEKLRKSHGIHKLHCLKQKQGITIYWEPFFKGRFLGDITASDIDAFINDMGNKEISASRKNVVIKAGTKPLRWAFSKGKIDKDPTRGHIMFSGEERKRDILNPTAAAAAFRAVWKDERAKLANMLAAVTGMRSGEILALRFQDIGPDCLYIRGSWNRADKIKLPKNNKIRKVELPFPDLIHGLLELAKQTPWGLTPDSFVFWTETKKDIPMWGRLFVDGLREALIQIGFTKSEAAKYMFHGWRHFFTSYMIRKLDKKLLKSQTGHLTDEMLAHYGDHETDGDREIIQATEREAFAGLLPERILLLEYKGDTKTAAA